MKKTLTLFLCFVLLAGCLGLTGCSETDLPPKEETKTEAIQETTKTAESEEEADYCKKNGLVISKRFEMFIEII